MKHVNHVKSYFQTLKNYSKKYDKDMKFCNIDTKSAPRIAIKQKVLSLPVIRIYEDGKILDETSNGDVTIENIENMIKKFV